MRVEKIHKLTRVDPRSPGLRTDVIQDTLERLMSREKVGRGLFQTRHAYYLTDTGRKATDEAAESLSSSLSPFYPYAPRYICVVQRTRRCPRLSDIRIGVCFARFGQQIAKSVTGELTKDKLTRLVEREQTRLDQLLVQTWGVWLHEAPVGARSVVLPRGTLTPSS